MLKLILLLIEDLLSEDLLSMRYW